MRFEELTEQQLLAPAISLEEEDGRIYRDFAEAFRADYAAAAELFTRLADEESQHRHRLLDLFSGVKKRLRPTITKEAGRWRLDRCVPDGSGGCGD